MTLIELLFFLLCLGLGIVGSVLGRAASGPLGIFVGFVVGAFAVPILGTLLVRLSDFLYGPWPGPPCPCGQPADRLIFARSDEHGHVSACACGIRLVRRRGRVFQIDRGHAVRPYLQWHPRKGSWLPFGQPSRGPGPYR